MKLFLIGMPGSGKTTLGKPLAEALRIPFVDLDRLIEEQESDTISAIFASKGEDYFRAVEAKTLKEWATSSGSFVMATGGGTPCFHSGIQMINNNGVSVWLRVPFEELLRRTSRNHDRPLLADENGDAVRQRLQVLYDKRLPVYRQANLILDDATVPQVLQQLSDKGYGV